MNNKHINDLAGRTPQKPGGERKVLRESWQFLLHK